jgi:replication factor C subunit 1
MHARRTVWVRTEQTMESLRDCCIAVTGGICTDPILSFLRTRNVRIIPWASSIRALIRAGPPATSWKLAQARARGIPIIPAEDLHAFATQPRESELWVTKYAPTKLEEIVGNADAIAELRAWLTAGGAGGALVTGPPGIGKTTAVHCVIRALGYDVVELNASDERSGTAIRKWFEEAARSHHVGKRRVVVMDEVDGCSSGDRGGIAELARIIRTCSFPIVCIANERTTPRLRPLAAVCRDIRFQRPPRTQIARALMTRVVAPERLSITQAELETLCERNGNDIRQILNFLQFRSAGSLCAGTATAAATATVTAKDEVHRIDPFSATVQLYRSSVRHAAKSQLVFVDHGLVPLMIGESYVAAAGKSRGDDAEKLRRVAAAADAMGDYDIVDARLRRTMNWGLLPAAVEHIVRAATVVDGCAPSQIFPQWLGKASKRNKHRRMMRELGARSGHDIDARDVLRARLFAPTRTGAEIVDDLAELRMTRDDMLETLVDTVFTGEAASVALDTKTKSAITREWKKRGMDSAATAATACGGGSDEIEYESDDCEEFD